MCNITEDTLLTVTSGWIQEVNALQSWAVTHYKTCVLIFVLNIGIMLEPMRVRRCLPSEWPLRPAFWCYQIIYKVGGYPRDTATESSLRMNSPGYS